MSKNILNFCTLFDQKYLIRGIALIESLQKHEPSCHIFVLAMDALTENVLKNRSSSQVTVIHLSDFESPELLSIKSSRSKGEYCWTCTPHLINYCLKSFGLDDCTYVDADIFFFQTPRVLIDEAKDKSIIITDHRYTPKYDQTATSGKYCVQFMHFKNTADGNTALNWWQDKCTEWCFNRQEDGKFGDQKYLDDWCTRFFGVHELLHLGGGLAPWNIQQYQVTNCRPLQLNEKASNNRFDGVFYHFHELKLISQRFCDLGHYDLSQDIIKAIYAPYLKTLEENRLTLEKTYLQKFDYTPVNWWSLGFLKASLKRALNGTLFYCSISKLVASAQKN